MAPILVAVHALGGALFLGALVGRWIVLGLAERAESIGAITTLTRAAAPFERIVIVGGTIVIGLGVITAIVQGRPFLGPLQGGTVDWLFVSLVLLLTAAPLPPVVFLPRGRVFEAAMAEATARGTVTPELRAAFRDPVVRAAHVYELVVVSLVFVLMISKPF